MEFKDYYQILGVDEQADEKTIKAAYRKLAHKYHPDVSKATDAESKFKELTEAYEVLKNREKRAEYDQLRKYGGNGHFQPPPGWQQDHGFSSSETFANGDFSEFFNTIFGNRGNSQGFDNFSGFSSQRARTRKGDDIESELALFLEDTLEDCTKTIHYQLPQVNTDGSRQTVQKKLSVKIPKGARDGERIRLKGQGARGYKGGANGDLYLRIRLAPHPQFKVNGHDLTFIAAIAPWEAVLGGKVTVPTLEGKIQLTVPENSQSGQKLRVKGKGLASKVGRGDLIVELNIVVPPASNDQQKQLWQSMANSYDFEPRATI